MSRFELGGWGPPIPLPEDSLENIDDPTNLLPVVYNLPHGTIFRPLDYTSFGYTHYEVVVIGAAGGWGGAVLGLSGISAWGSNGALGGGGGGGGLQVVSGRLDELPEEVPVVVGQPGAIGINGNGAPRYAMMSAPWLDPVWGSYGIYEVLRWSSLGPNRPPYVSGGNPIPPYVKLPGIDEVMLPQDVLLPQHHHVSDIEGRVAHFRQTIPPTDGEDGEASKFGEIAKASGGKGGKKSPYYRDVQNSQRGYIYGPGGEGGEGGIGGSEVAGGGGAGGKAHPELTGTVGPSYDYNRWVKVAAEDGSWDSATGIGKGGGGGRGGSFGPDEPREFRKIHVGED